MSRPLFSPEGVTLGVSLIAIGGLWTLANMGRVDLLGTLHTWWPLALVLWGVLELALVVLRRHSERS